MGVVEHPRRMILRIICQPNKITYMKEYDHEDDKEEQPSQIIQNEEYQRMEEEYNFAKITAEVNQLSLQLKAQDQLIRQLSKEASSKVTEYQLSETLALINSGIQSDPNMIKLLKTREALLSQDEQTNKIKINSLSFSKKLNQMSQALGILLASIRKLQSKITTVQSQLSAQLSEKLNSQQTQLEQGRSEQVKENMELQQKMELLSFELGDKMRDIETKNSWKLSEFKSKIDQKISEQFVKTYLQQVQAKMDKNMRAFQLKSNINPERIDKIEQQIQANSTSHMRSITECQYKLAILRGQFQEKAVKRLVFEEDKLKIEKRLNLFNNNFDQVYKRVRVSEEREIGMDQNISKLLKDNDEALQEVKRINSVLTNLKIGEDFQKMLAQMNPTKILELQDRVEGVHNQQAGIYREIELAKRQIQKVNAKAEVMGIMAPNQLRQQFRKEELQQALTSFLNDHQFSQKIANIDRQLSHYKLSIESINLLTRQVARIQKEDQSHKLHNSLRNLEEMVKKEFLLIQNQIKEKGGRVDSDRERPVSKGASNTSEVVPIGESFQNKSFSLRKLSRGASISGIPSQAISSIRANLGREKL